MIQIDIMIDIQIFIRKLLYEVGRMREIRAPEFYKYQFHDYKVINNHGIVFEPVNVASFLFEIKSFNKAIYFTTERFEDKNLKNICYYYPFDDSSKCSGVYFILSINFEKSEFKFSDIIINTNYSLDDTIYVKYNYL